MNTQLDFFEKPPPTEAERIAAHLRWMEWAWKLKAEDIRANQVFTVFGVAIADNAAPDRPPVYVSGAPVIIRRVDWPQVIAEPIGPLGQQWPAPTTAGERVRLHVCDLGGYRAAHYAEPPDIGHA